MTRGWFTRGAFPIIAQEDLEVAQERKLKWEKAKAICNALGVRCSFAMNRDHGDTVGNAYAYPPLEVVLWSLDEADVTYDNIDLPADTPADFVSRLRSAYPPGQGIWVNVQGR